MGIKTTIGPKGLVNTRVAGPDVLELSVTQKRTITVVGVDASVTASAGTTLFRPETAVGVTGVLPGINDSVVGTEYSFLKNSGSNPLLLSASNPIIGSPFTAVGSWKCAVSASAGRYACLAVSGSTGYQWFVAGSTF